MNKELDNVAGTVEYVSTKFNGSVKINGKFYNFAKGKSVAVNKGDNVTLTLEPWESNGKSGVNIVSLEKNLNVKPEYTKQPETKLDQPKAEVKTDWAAKDRSQLVGGRSHDAVELVKASLNSGTPMTKVLELYKEALVGILKLVEEIK